MESSQEPGLRHPKPLSDEPDLDLYTIPSYSSWFSWNYIHEIEKLSLREFFDASSITRNPRIYKEYRDFIISKYREDPSRRLTFTEVRKSLVGDISVLHKVFTFLEKWGLINFNNVDAQTASRSREDDDDDKEDERWSVRVEEGAPHGVRVVAAPNSLKPLVPPPPPPPVSDGVGRGGGGGVAAAENGFKFPPLASYCDIYEELLQQRKRTKDVGVCGNCKEQCVSGYYEYAKEESFILCGKCFKDHSYENKSGDDFKFIDKRNLGAVWTEAETLLLLESVLKYGDDWDLVAQNVITKSKLDCISKLIQLPFGDLMLGSAYKKSRLLETNGAISQKKQVHPDSAGPQQIVKSEGLNHEGKNESRQNGAVTDQSLPPTCGTEKQGSPPRSDTEKHGSPPRSDAEKQGSPPRSDAEKQGSPSKSHEEKQSSPPKSGAEKQNSRQKSDAEKQSSPLQSDTEKQSLPPNSGAEKQSNSSQNEYEKQVIPLKSDANMQGSPLESDAVKKGSSPRSEYENEGSPLKGHAEMQVSPLNSGNEKEGSSPKRDIENDGLAPQTDTEEQGSSQKLDATEQPSPEKLPEKLDAEEQGSPLKVDIEKQGVLSKRDSLDSGPPPKRACLGPTANSGSALMKQVARISSMVAPHITAAAAEAAVTTLCYENQCSREISDEDDPFGDESGSSSQNNKQERTILPESSQLQERGSDGQQTLSRNAMPLILRMKAATATALGAAAAHAKLLADQEEREISQLVATIIEAQLKKVERKAKHIDGLELILEKQQDQMKVVEESLLAERIDALQRIFGAGISRWKDTSVKPEPSTII